MDNYTNKIYARLNESNIVTKLFSSVFEQPEDGDFLIEEGNKEYHAHVHLKYALIDEDGNYNYIVKNNQMVELTNEEKAELFPKVEQVVELTEQHILNAKLLQGYANMQLESEQQKQLNAQILLQIAGGVTNV